MLTIKRNLGMVKSVYLEGDGIKTNILITDVIVFDPETKETILQLGGVELWDHMKKTEKDMILKDVTVIKRIKPSNDDIYYISNKTKEWYSNVISHTLYVSNKLVNFKHQGFTKWIDYINTVYYSNVLDIKKSFIYKKILKTSDQLLRDFKEDNGERSNNFNFIYNKKEFDMFLNNLNDFKKVYEKAYNQDLKDFETFKNNNKWID